MNKRSTVIIVSGIAAAVVIGLAISIHLRLSALEPEGHRADETPHEVMNEILTGQPAHQEEGEEQDGSAHSEDEATKVEGHEENR